ncbi:acyltransferase [Leptospira perolatii]|uniref:Acyltransferase n=1 Tax=Leptospira perolatii TaxID=2023191 RepID=A0A2M9ZQ39_9LEPT|nr:1-acyl-sn-glycerol-3-phosphate acyltransferase [Leptospira perolatii]PJZ68074.1 acyltransferase [Leptospira perolatii]PJZ74190.1 acyltransferase [Leptospira perolatii]
MNPFKFLEARLGRFSKEYRKLVVRVYVVALRLVLTTALPDLIAGLFYAAIGNRPRQYSAFLRGAKKWGNTIRKMTKTNLVLANEMQIPQSGHMIFVNHVNELDFPYDCLTINKPFLANQVIKKTFIAYWWMKAMGSQVFETTKATTIAVSVRKLLKGLATTSYIIYPEGHNSYTEVIHPYLKGMVKIAYENQIPVVLVIKSGITTYQLRSKDATVGYKYLGSFQPTQYSTWEQFRDAMHDLMSKEKEILDNQLGIPKTEWKAAAK